MKFEKLIPHRFRMDIVTVPVVRLNGVIAASSSPISRKLSLASVAPLLEKAFSMKNARAVALAVNSPGGSPVQSRLIVSRIRELAKKYDKKTFVFVEDIAASGGYMISLAGDEIFADETSIVGSIGVVSAGFGFSKTIEKLGIERRVYTAGKNKAPLDPFRPESKKDVDYLKKLQLELHEVFMGMVKKSRGEKLVEDEEMFTGRFWTGAGARKLGLIDGLGHMSEVLKDRYGDRVRLQLIQPRKNFFGLGGGGNEGINTRFALDSTGAGVVNAAVETLEEKNLWARFGL